MKPQCSPSRSRRRSLWCSSEAEGLCDEVLAVVLEGEAEVLPESFATKVLFGGALKPNVTRRSPGRFLPGEAGERSAGWVMSGALEKSWPISVR